MHTMTCKHCGEEITAEGEDTMVERVQLHFGSHGDKPPLTRDHILRRLHRNQRDEHQSHT
jgi:hypothetical protein